MDDNNLEKIKGAELGDVVRVYFKGLSKGYSSDTLEAYKKILENRFGITDFKQLKTDFKNGKYY